jgi:predicted nucleic acid-binding protein
VIAYLDTSVLIRILLREEKPLRAWRGIELGITSEITRVECYRTLDRLRVMEVLDDEEHATKTAEVDDLLSRIDTIRLTKRILARASEPLPTVIGTLDAIHLVSAMTYRDKQPKDEPPIYIATHDNSLGACARVTGFRVLGL